MRRVPHNRAKPFRPLSRDEVRRVDRVAIEELGLPGVVLMENAGLGLTDRVEETLSQLGAGPGASVVIVCGKGNNGGDGFVLARQLRLRSFAPRVVYTGLLAEADRTSDAGINLDVLEKSGLAIREAPQPAALAAALEELAGEAVLLVDALFGTGVAGELRGPGLEQVQALEACPLPKLAVDIPSGLDCDRGQPLGAAVRCLRTVTFVAPKLGFREPGAREFTGPVDVVPIGCPEEAWAFLDEE